jgi:hypothetical protein
MLWGQDIGYSRVHQSNELLMPYTAVIQTVRKVWKHSGNTLFRKFIQYVTLILETRLQSKLDEHLETKGQHKINFNRFDMAADFSDICITF